LPKEKREDFSLEELGQEAVLEGSEMMKPPLRIFTALCYQAVEVRMKIYLLSKCLDDGHHPGSKLSAGCDLEVFEESLDSCLTKIPQKPALVLEEDAQHLRDSEDDLAVGNIQKKLIPHPLSPLLKPLRMAGGAEPPGATGKHQ